MDMQTNIIDHYNLFFRFIDQYQHKGFKDIDRLDPIILQLEELTRANNQFYFIFDLIQLKVLFSSQRSLDMMGVDFKDFNPSCLNKAMHQDDIFWYSMIQTKLLNFGQQLFIDNQGGSLLSTNFKLRNSSDEYVNTLLQCYLFFAEVPYKTVYILQVLTDISWFTSSKPGYHFYMGNDPYYFRYPDEKLLLKGSVFSNK